MMWALAAILAVVMGTVLGLLGGGGSILALPILTYVLGLTPKAAIATSLLVVGTTSAAAVIAHIRQRNVVWKVAFTFAPFAMFGAFAGGFVAQWISGTALLIGFASMMVVASVSMWKGRREDVEIVRVGAFWLALEAMAVGFLTGMVGAGGGFMIVPVLLFFVGLEMKQAVGTSLVVISANSFAGFAGYAGHVDLNWPVAGAFVVFAVLGSFVGATLAAYVDARKLRRGFAVFVIAIAVFILGREMTTQRPAEAEIAVAAERA